MERAQLKEEIIYRLTGGVLKCDLDDKALDMTINAAMREIQRYIDSTKIVTIPYKRCIDMTPYKVNSVSRVYRTQGYTSSEAEEAGPTVDPMFVQQWQVLSGTGNLQNFQNYALDYASWNTLLQIRNTIATDLIFKYDKSSEQLYVSISSNQPDKITIEYVPRYDDISEIKSDFWIDNLTKLSVALAKIAVGRIRTRYGQSNAQWTQDGEKLLEEGNSELQALRDALVKATQLCYPID